MICVSYADLDFTGLVKMLNEQKPEIAELRLDLLNLSNDELKKILALDFRFISTCKDKNYFEKLSNAIEYGTDYVDIDIEMDEAHLDGLMKQLKAAKLCKLITSYHNYDKTPVIAELERVIEWCLEKKPDVIKIACMVKDLKDNARLLGLLDTTNKMIVIGMGEQGRVTRVLATKLGAFCTYVSAVKNKETALGQLSFEEIKKIMEAMSIV